MKWDFMELFMVDLVDMNGTINGTYIYWDINKYPLVISRSYWKWPLK
jgi:hypothetical protein